MEKHECYQLVLKEISISLVLKNRIAQSKSIAQNSNRLIREIVDEILGMRKKDLINFLRIYLMILKKI